jgi:DNA-binding GntR family transcriptional regulator
MILSCSFKIPVVGFDTMNPSIDRNSPVPLYYQLEQHIRRRVQAGVLKAGDPIENEGDLQRLFNVSRTTVRQALSNLAKDGIVVRRRGAGTFVADIPQPAPLSCTMSFTREMLAQGRVPRTDVLAFTLTVAEGAVRTELELPEGARVHHIRRLRSVDGVPVCLVDSYVPQSAAPGLRVSDFEPTGLRQSMLYVLEHVHGLEARQGEEWVVPAACSAEDARLLAVADLTATVRDICIARSPIGTPILYEESTWGTVVRRRLFRLDRLPSREPATAGRTGA